MAGAPVLARQCQVLAHNQEEESLLLSARTATSPAVASLDWAVGAQLVSVLDLALRQCRRRRQLRPDMAREQHLYQASSRARTAEHSFLDRMAEHNPLDRMAIAHSLALGLALGVCRARMAGARAAFQG